MDWDPALGEASPVFLRNHPSAFAESGFVSTAIAEGVAACTMLVCARHSLVCILQLGVAFNSVGKRSLIWDCQHVNKNLRKRKFKMETLQREGRTLFERSNFGFDTVTCQLHPALCAGSTVCYVSGTLKQQLDPATMTWSRECFKLC